MTYTIEDVINVINEELEDVYTEASKEEADKVEDLGKKTRAYEKMAAFDTDKAGSSRPGVGFNSPKTEPKGNKETIRKKNIRKAFGGQYIHYDTGEAGKARAKMKDSQNAVSKLITGKDSPFPENYFIKDSIRDHIDMIKYRKAKKAKVAEEDCCKESAEEFTEASDEYKNIKKLLNNNAKKEKDKIKSSIKNCDGKHGTCLSSQSAVLDNLMKDLSAKEKEKLVKFALKKDKGIKNLNAKVDKMALKESTMSDIYEAYCDDVIDAETAMGLLLTIEASEY